MEVQRLGFRDALLLAEQGFVVPTGNIIYDDADIAPDEDFDATAWQGQPTGLQDFLTAKGIVTAAARNAAITVEIAVEDPAVQRWLHDNHTQLNRIMEKLVVDLYHTDRMLHAK